MNPDGNRTDVAHVADAYATPNLAQLLVPGGCVGANVFGLGVVVIGVGAFDVGGGMSAEQQLTSTRAAVMRSMSCFRWLDFWCVDFMLKFFHRGEVRTA